MSNIEQQMIFGMTAMSNFAKSVEYAFKAGGSFFGTLFDAFRLSRDGKEVKEYLGADKNIVPYICDVNAENQIYKELKDAKIPFMRSNYGSLSLILVADNQKDAVDRIMDKCRSLLMCGGNVTKDILWAQADGKVNKITGLSEEEAILFESKAEARGVHITVQQREANDYAVLFDKKDIKEIAEISSSVVYDLSGQHGDILNKQLHYERDNQDRIFARMKDAKDDLFYVIDVDGKEAAIQGLYAKFHSPELTEVVKRDSDEMIQNFSAMKNPIDLSKEEYEKYHSLDEKERKEYLEKISKKHGYPQLTKEESELMQTHERDRSLIEKKLVLENPIQGFMENSITNNEIRMGEFSDINRDNWEDLHDDIETFKMDPNLYNDARARQQAFIIKEENRSPEDDLREEQFLSGHYDEKDYREDADHEKSYHEEYMDFADKDRNGIPDDMEERDFFDCD